MRIPTAFLQNCLATAALVLLAGGFAFPARAAQPLVSIIADTKRDPAARHGIDKIAAALKEKRVSFESARSLDAAKGKMLIVAGLAGSDPVAGLLAGAGRAVPKNPEALVIQKVDYQGRAAWVLGGADDRGLMYAELDVADRIRWSTNKSEPLAEVRDTSEKPDMATRTMTLFTMNRAYWESRFYDEAYWRRYLDMLAQNRFNSMVVIFGYEDGGFLAPCYPYFFDLPDYPGIRMIAINPAQQKRNVEALNQLIAMAHERGIEFNIGIWDHIYRGGVQNGGSPGGNDGLKQPTPNLVWGVNADNLIPYTQTALVEFLKRFPGIDGIQFRMHDESGLKVSEQGRFWKAIFQTIKQTAPNLPLDLRAKGLTAEEIQSALDAGMNFRISTKYWMEQMGLPFHPLHINPRDQSNRRHSYADLLVYPQKYKMTWQLWNGGTARILLWADPEYARRFVETAHLYDGDNFAVDEPLTTKMEAQPHDARPFALLKPSARYYDYEFERYWHLFQVFGRIGYNPATPSEVWDREFAARFGAAGTNLETALHTASWILPRIVASSYPYSGFPMTAGWPEKQHLGDLPTFAKATLSEVQLFENFDEEAKLLVEGGETAKVRPQETSHWFEQTAQHINEQLAEADKKVGRHRSKEYESTVVDLKILANLALYHARRIPAAVNYRLYDRTKDITALDEAIAGEQNAIEAWRALVAAAGDVYAPDLMMGARSRGLCGNWKDELASLEQGLTKLNEQRSRAASNTVFTVAPRYPLWVDDVKGPSFVRQPAANAPARQPLRIRVQAHAPSGIKWVQVLYRSVNQTKDYETLTMKAVDDQGNFEAVIPAEKIDPQFDFMYFIQAMDNEHHGAMYPDFNRQTPYYIVRLER